MLILLEDVMTHDEFIEFSALIKKKTTHIISSNTAVFVALNIINNHKLPEGEKYKYRYLYRQFVYLKRRDYKTFGNALLLREFNSFMLGFLPRYEGFIRDLFTKNELENFKKKGCGLDVTTLPVMRLQKAIFQRIRGQNLILPALSDNVLLDHLIMYSKLETYMNRNYVRPYDEKAVEYTP